MNTIEPIHISIILQGAYPTEATEQEQLRLRIAGLRELLSGATIILSTWRDGNDHSIVGADRVVHPVDPGPQPGFKYGPAGLLNNLNRQLAGAAIALAAITTRYTLRLRIDSTLDHADFLQWYATLGKNAAGGERILASSFFTIDPRSFEQMPFHLSDWFQFGPTAKLCVYWSATPLSDADACYYDSRPHAGHSSFFDCKYRARYAAEQVPAIAYAASLGYATPAFHNDVRPDILDEHDRFMSSECLILNPWQIGLVCPKYVQFYRSSFQHLNGLMFLDWVNLAQRFNNAHTLPIANLRTPVFLRHCLKNLTYVLARYGNRMAPLFCHQPIKFLISRLLRALLT